MRLEFDAIREEQRETITTLRQSLDETRSSSSDLRVRHGRLQAEVSFLNDKYDTLFTTTAGEREELERLRIRNAETSRLVVEHQRRSQALESDVARTTSDLKASETRRTRSETERNLMQTSLERAREDVARLKEDRERQSTVSDAMRRLESHLDDSSATESARVAANMLRLEEELESMKKSREEVSEKMKSDSVIHRRDILASKSALDRTKGELTSAKEENVRLSLISEERAEDIHVLRTELEKAKVEVEERDRTIVSIQNVGEGTEPLVATASQLQRLKLEITTARADANGALATAKEKDKHIEEFKAIARANEEALETKTTLATKEILTLTETLKETNVELEKTKILLSERQEDLKSSQSEQYDLQKATEEKLAALKKKTMESEEKESQARVDLESAIKQRDLSDRHAGKLISL